MVEEVSVRFFEAGKMESRKLVLRCRSKNKVCTLDQMTLDCTFNDLKVHIADMLNLDVCKLKIRHGFPPRVIDVNDEVKLADVPLKTADLLIVDEDGSSARTTSSQTSVAAVSPVLLLPQHQEQQQITDIAVLAILPEGMLLQCVMPANNSCLFASVYFAHTKTTLTDYHFLRNIIATAVAADPVTYNEGFLGKSNSEYCRWILQDDHWGGAIELSILCKHYNFEIVIIDLISAQLYHFGEDYEFQNRIFLLYNGVHYDAVALKPNDPDAELKTVFSLDDEIILQKANDLAVEGKLKKQDPVLPKSNPFLCLICKVIFKNRAMITDHARKTGHNNFAMIDK